MPEIGIAGLAVILIVGLLVFGPKRFSEVGRSLGKGMREFKDSITGKDENAHPAELPAATEPDPKEPSAICRGDSAE